MNPSNISSLEQLALNGLIRVTFLGRLYGRTFKRSANQQLNITVSSLALHGRLIISNRDAHAQNLSAGIWPSTFFHKTTGCGVPDTWHCNSTSEFCATTVSCGVIRNTGSRSIYMYTPSTYITIDYRTILSTGRLDIQLYCSLDRVADHRAHQLFTWVLNHFLQSRHKVAKCVFSQIWKAYILQTIIKLGRIQHVMHQWNQLSVSQFLEMASIT